MTSSNNKRTSSVDSRRDSEVSLASPISNHVVPFIDVVRAYKGVLKEKEALETSLRALNTSCSTPSRDRPHNVVSEGEGEVSGSEGYQVDKQDDSEGVL